MEIIAEKKLSNQYHYVDPESPEDGCFPESQANCELSELKKVYDKGHPIMWENF